MTDPTIRLKEAALKRGYIERNDAVLHLWLSKDYDTAVGVKDAQIVVRTASSRAEASYYSERRNILMAESWLLNTDPDKALDSCEDVIDRSYARQLWLNRQKEGQPHD